MPTATLPIAHQRQFEAAARQGLDTLNAHYGTQCSYPEIRWSLSGRGCLGKVSSIRNTRTGEVTVRYVALHKGYAKALGSEYLETVLHEICHVITLYRAAQLANSSRVGDWTSHGYHWSAAMRVLGLRPDRLATVAPELQAQAATKRKTTKYRVSCACKTYLVSPQKAASITRPGIICRTCRNPYRKER